MLAEEAGQLLLGHLRSVASGQTGAARQRQALATLEPRLGREQALTAMLEHYLEHQRTGEPVHTWPSRKPGNRHAIGAREALCLWRWTRSGRKTDMRSRTGEHAGRCALLQHHQVPDAPVVHLGRGHGHVPAGRGGHDRGGHVIRDPRLPDVTEPGGGVHHVALGEDAADLAARPRPPSRCRAPGRPAACCSDWSGSTVTTGLS